MDRRTEIILATSETGASRGGSSEGPLRLLETLKNQNSLPSTVSVSKTDVFKYEQPAEHPFPFAHHIDILHTALSQLTGKVEDALSSGHFPLIFSGDHSNAIGSISGLVNHNAAKETGVIWVDAHFDLHSPYTTPSGNIHGMALNAMIGGNNESSARNQPQPEVLEWWTELKKLGSARIHPKIKPENIVFIGVRDYEKEEDALVNKYGIKWFDMNAVHTEGMHSVMEKTLDYLSHCDQLYVSFDVDSLDPGISSATGTPVAGGLNMKEAQIIFDALYSHPKIAMFEITEINPSLEEGNKMCETVAQFLQGRF